MKKFIFMAALACLTAGCKNAPVEDVEVGPYTVSYILNNVYHIEDCNSSNPSGESNNCSDIYLVVGRKQALVIDLSNNIKWADNAPESLRAIISERAGKKPVTVTFTHSHGDHTGMAAAMMEYPGVVFALPKVDFERSASRYADVENFLYDEGYEFDLGGYKVGTVLVPGHTPGSVVFDLEGENILFTGDAIGSGKGVWIFNEDGYHRYEKGIPHLIEYIESKGIDKNALKIYGGHYWQKDWLNLPEGTELGWEYIADMQELINRINNKTADWEPSNLGRNGLDTYFRYGNSMITYSLAAAGMAPEEEE